MRRGDFAAAWAETDLLESERPFTGRRAHHLLWDGSPPDGRDVFVRCLHGLGDTLQFSRFLPALRRRARSLTVAVQPPLISLFRAQPDFGRIVDGYVDYQCPDGALEMEIMELAYCFRVTARTLPPPVLRVPEAPPVSPGNLRVALFWRSSGWGGGRQVPLAAFDGLAQAPDVDFYSFQQGASAEELASSALNLSDRSDTTTDILDLAAALCEMDLIIAVDSMPAHLAGSLRRPTWLLLDAHADWRWMDHGATSPWYPTMRIFRQNAISDFFPRT